MKKNNIQNLKEAIEATLKSLGIKQKIDQYSAFSNWEEIVGEKISKVTTPEKIQNNTLVVKVNSAPWQAELTFRKKEILEKIHTKTESKAIKNIIFR
ncbi:MAG: DUF721 domain-containing protein [Bacteroidetes bacterium]|nr:DUF721 domain-containing protein [Bacteroidota bacterium]